jgi:prepilin-type N-terminal cleavage/methylation domain-containing protein
MKMTQQDSAFDDQYVTMPRANPSGFTLVELLVVIGIIAILMGILIPTVAVIRRAAYDASTGVEISNLANAINQYHGDFGSYPGPFSNDQIEFGTPAVASPTVPTIPMEWYDPTTATYKSPSSFPSPSATPYPNNWTVTGAQNLVLGLLGGLRVDPANGIAAFAPMEVGLGPLSLDPANPRRYMNYMSASSGGQSYLWSGWKPTSPALAYTADQGGGAAGDSPFPVLVDRYPNSLPIQYLRARVGAKGIISDGKVIDPTTNAPAIYQYDLREIFPYVQPSSNVGLPITVPPALPINHNLLPQAGPISPADYENFIDHTSATFNLLQVVKKGQTTTPDAGACFNNPSSPATNTTTDNFYNNTGRPRQVDQFILISAGSDGIYGTADDKTNFGDWSH